MNEAESFKVVLKMQLRKDGGLRVYSDNVPGLVLSNKDPQKVLADIKPALETILSEVMGCDVHVSLLSKLPAALLERRHTVHPAPRRSRTARSPAPIYARRKTLEYAAQPCG